MGIKDRGEMLGVRVRGRGGVEEKKPSIYHPGKGNLFFHAPDDVRKEKCTQTERVREKKRDRVRER